MNRRSILLIAVCLLILAGGGYWLSTKLERYTHQWDSGPELDVSFNPWHAAQTLLETQNKESHRSFNLHPVFERLQPYDGLVLHNASTVSNPATRERLENWVHDGGHLIITALEEWDFEQEFADPFLDDYGVRLYHLEEDDTDAEEVAIPEALFDSETETETDAQDESEAAAAQTCAFTNYDNLFDVKWNGEWLQVESYGFYSLDDEYGEAEHTGNTWPNAVLQYRVGAGKLTVLMDTSIWHNDRIGDYDHAYFLWQLVKADDTIWFVSSNESENLLDKLWRTAPYLLIGIGSLLILWGWRRWVRFGPLQPDPGNEHRQLLEHIEAATRFDWNHHRAGNMVESLRNDIKTLLMQHHNLNFDQEQARCCELIAHHSQLDPHQIQLAMSAPSPEREHPWTELIAQLQTIRNAL
ncbi:MAG: hypothetical protein CMK83_19165 [Pseudomonadales bacterium]|nr:hypothetical protein [Pseudomonadales bacterium]HAU12362.1 hypothetical protein [Gammaproteobacteria bacterium]HBO96328.1 hypothetical protein [Gammaproteobacteria bacterium]|tara:strand:+ start:516 stop:1748 length:1233 start_codon:yes stop_codon:yes gene_type:complete